MVVERLRRLLGAGVVKRLGVIVRHHECGYRHNAMVVWDVPAHAVHRAGRRLAAENVVRLCYRRPRRPPDWPYNLFCMIHGKDREDVLAEVGDVACRTGLDSFPRDVLFSARRFKQRGARYDFNDATAPPPLGARP
jgi:DNA-binding Lrp family transcriptional regulator